MPVSPAPPQALAPVITVLLVDDDPGVLRSQGRALTSNARAPETYSTAKDAVARVARGGVHVVVSDIAMPGMSGMQLLRSIREYDADLPVILVTGSPSLDSAAEAVEYGAFKYLVKPVLPKTLRDTVDRAAQLYRFARMKRQALELLGNHGGAADQAGLETNFERALNSIWIAYQPIVGARGRSIFGYEALLRSDEPTLPGPGHLLDAAARLGELTRLGRAIRSRVLEPFEGTPITPALFVNLHPQDLSDPELLEEDSPLGRSAGRIVLEITERASLGNISNIREKIARLREIGYRIALDDLGAGYAGLTSFALLEPEIVKIDMSLVREIDKSPIKQKLVQAMTALCEDMGIFIVAEGVETKGERDVLVQLGCDLFQGYLFARPGPAFPTATWDTDVLQECGAIPLPASGIHRIDSVGPGGRESSAPATVASGVSSATSPVIPTVVLESLPDGMILIDAVGQIVYANRAAKRILGARAGEGSPTDWTVHHDVFRPEGSESFPLDQYPLDRALRGEETNDAEMWFRNPIAPDGVLVSVTGRPLRNEHGAIVGAFAVFRDITKIRRAQRSLERQNAELEGDNISPKLASTR